MSDNPLSHYFIPGSQDANGKIDMFCFPGESRKSVYLTNLHGRKLLKILIKDEPGGSLSENYAQLKVIHYGIKRALVWADKPNDPAIERLQKGVEITCHGTLREGKPAKIHVKGISGYKTLLNASFDMPALQPIPVPILSLEAGYANHRLDGESVQNKSHVVSSGREGSVRFDIYFLSADADLKKLFHSMYFLSLFWTPDYLVKVKSGKLSSGLMIPPMNLLKMGKYQLLVRRSESDYRGQPILSFFNNKDYYHKFMNRIVAYREPDGSLVWTNMYEMEEKIMKSQCDTCR